MLIIFFVITHSLVVWR